MYKVSKILNYFVFIATTIAIAGVFCEGMAMKLFAITYPVWSLVFWYFYIWFVYGIQITNNKE